MNAKKIIIVILLLALLAGAVVVAYKYNKSNNTNKNNSESSVAEYVGEIPKLSYIYDGQEICSMNGYLMDVDPVMNRGNVAAISPARGMSVKLSLSEGSFKSVKYEIKTANGKEVLDKGDFKETGTDDTGHIFESTVGNTLDSGSEYLLIIHVSTDKFEDIRYNSRVMLMDEEFVSEQIKFAKSISDLTLSGSKAIDLAGYLETDGTADNDNMGLATLKSSFSAMTWKNLTPVRNGEIRVSAKDFYIKSNGESGTYTLYYQVRATNAQKVTETYNVAETITVWSYANRQYILAYDREVNQVWVADDNNIGNLFIDLGIQNMTDIEHSESDNGKFIAFEINGDVYCMDVEEKRVSQVFSLEADNSEKIYDTRVKVISVGDEGAVNFMIYGYSPTTEHAGMNGIIVMSYNYKNNESTEQVFIPSPASAAVLDTKVSKLCYIGDNTLYIMIGDNIYYANLNTKEWGVLVEDLEPDAYVVNSLGTVIAYNSDGKSCSDSITLVNLTNGMKKSIDAKEGEKVSVCGYSGENLIYGIGSAENAGKNDYYAKNKIIIADRDLKEMASYEREGIYIGQVEVQDKIINMKRYKGITPIEDDQILNNTEGSQTVASSSYYMDDLKNKELVLTFNKKLNVKTELYITKPGDIKYDSKSAVDAKFRDNHEELFYAYGYGRLQGIFTKQSESERCADKYIGNVYNSDGRKIWTKEEHYGGQ